MKLKLGFIGSGNVAWHLSHALDSAGHTISQIISRNEAHAKTLAERFDAFYSDKLHTFDVNLDVCIICVSDDQISEVVNQLPASECIITHTCGSQSIDILKDSSPNIGVFYPLQSFSKEKDVDMLSVPFLLEASNSQTSDTLWNLANSIANKITNADSTTRLKYHLAAVLVNNFANHLFHEASNYLEANDLDFDVLKPIILETASKVQKLSPEAAQTGPAKRGDMDTIEKHRNLITSNPDLAKLYNFLTNRLGQFD